MRRVLLLLPTATYRAPDFLEAAREVGAEVVVASERRQALGAMMGERALTVPLSRPVQAGERIAAHAQRIGLDAVVAVDDQGVLAAAEAAARLGLAHNPPEAVAATRDKAELRRRLVGSGVAQPAFAVAGPDDDLAALVREVGAPAVLKPVSLSASRGVIRVDDALDAPAVGRRIHAVLADADVDGPLLVERFVAGAEVAVEGLLRGGALEVLALFDKPDPLDGPYFEETIYVTPSRQDEAVQAGIADTVARACAAVGLVEGPIHAEVRISEASGSQPSSAAVPQVWLLELAARSIGGLCSRALRFGAGASLEQVILRHALGLPLDDLQRADVASGVMMLPIPAAGTLTAVGGQAAARAVPGIVGLEITVPVGRSVQPLPEGDRYLGFLFARADTAEAVEAALRAAHAELEVTITAGS